MDCPWSDTVPARVARWLHACGVMATSKKAAAKKTSTQKSLKAGDKVEWSSSGGQSIGQVVKKVTGTAKVKGHVAKASAAEPQYMVQSDKSGGQAIHKPAELKKRGK